MKSLLRQLIDEVLLSESLRRYCAMYKASNDKWYLELADNEDDGYGEATTYGPFSSEDATHRYLSDNFSNSGGYDFDDSGTQEPPTTSPNGRPVQRPTRSSPYTFYGSR